MQTLWLSGIDWDDELPSKLADEWKDWYQNLTAISRVKIPRWTHFSPLAKLVEIHAFADASSKVYGTVVYLRVVTGRDVTISLQVAKSRVAPTRTISIPRLELCASHLISKLVSHYVNTVHLECKIHLWSDSRDVLCWVRSHPVRWKTFIANRCSEIQELTPGAHWHHVRSQDNPADIVSRDLPPELLESSKLWWQGSLWLQGNLDPWPTHTELCELESPSELKASSFNTTVKGSPGELSFESNLIGRYSSLYRLLRITALCIRFIFIYSIKFKTEHKLKIQLFKLKFLNFSTLSIGEVNQPPKSTPKSKKVRVVLAPQELNNARLLWIHLVQQAFFLSEIKKLESKGTLDSSNQLIKLNPFIDDGLLRVGGRLAFHTKL